MSSEEEEEEDPTQKVSNGPAMVPEMNEIPEAQRIQGMNLSQWYADGTPQFMIDHFEKYLDELWSGFADEEAVRNDHSRMIRKRNAELNRKTRRNSQTLGSVISKKAHHDRVAAFMAEEREKQLIVYEKADELIESAHLNKAFPRSKHDPYNYEAVLQEILERDAERQEIEEEEIGKGDILPHLEDITRAEAIADAGLKTFNRVSKHCSAPGCNKIAAHVCIVCGADGFCASCYRANRQDIMLYYRIMKFCDLCKMSHHTSCGENVRVGDNM